MSIIENYKKIIQEIKDIAAASGRGKEEIKVVAVSKTFPSDIIQDAIDSGIRLLGENKVQEAKAKCTELKGDYSLHLIGHLQSNKAKDAVKLFDVIHSIDKLSTAVKVDKEAGKIDKIQKILIQVNTSGEDTKSGIQPEKTAGLFTELLKLQNIELLGLMTIGPFTSNEVNIRKSFRLLKDLLNEVNSGNKCELKELSMGMSSDYRIAIEEGATILRIGSAIFGQRTYN